MAPFYKGTSRDSANEKKINKMNWHRDQAQQRRAVRRCRRHATSAPKLARPSRPGKRNLPGVPSLAGSPRAQFFSTLVHGMPRNENHHRTFGLVSHVINRPYSAFPLRLTRQFFSMLLSDTNTATGDQHGASSWLDNTHVDALGYATASASSSRLFYVCSTALTDMTNILPHYRTARIPDYIFEGCTPAAEVIATIAYVGSHWAATWWYPGQQKWFIAEGLNYDPQPAQYLLFRNRIQRHFRVVLHPEPERCYIGRQSDLHHNGNLVAINCGVIAAHVLHGLAQPNPTRTELFSVHVPQFMRHVCLQG
jgi:hypothetical protein